jgi:hypothetical protein
MIKKAIYFLLGSAAIGGAVLARRARRGAADLAEGARRLATEGGIANVDPQPLANPGAEGVDLEATERAHRDVRDLRERSPLRYR